MNKTSAPKFVKMFRENKLSNNGLERIISTMTKERELDYLGRGAEGVAHLVASPRASMPIVRKTYDPLSPYVSSKAIENKIKILKKFNNIGIFPKYFGKSDTATYHEFIRESPAKSDVVLANLRKLKEAGYPIHDVKPSIEHNVYGDKIIDFFTSKHNTRKGTFLNDERELKAIYLKELRAINKKRLDPEDHEEAISKILQKHRDRVDRVQDLYLRSTKLESPNKVMKRVHSK